MSAVVLTEAIIKMLVSDPESVSIKELSNEEENGITIQVIVSKDDLGIVLGKEGRTINSIRNIVQASSNLNEKKYVNIDVDSY